MCRLVADPGRSVMSARFRLPAGRSYNVRATELERDRQHTQVVCNILLLDNTVQAFKVNVSTALPGPVKCFTSTTVSLHLKVITNKPENNDTPHNSETITNHIFRFSLVRTSSDNCLYILGYFANRNCKVIVFLMVSFY